MGKHKFGCPPYLFNVPPPFNHNSNFAGTWNVNFSIYSVDDNGNYNLVNNPETVTVTITATSDSRFYQITIDGSIPMVGVVGNKYDNCGNIIGYYLINNGPSIPEGESPFQNTQLLRELVPVAWDILGNPIRLEAVATSYAPDSFDNVDIYSVLYGTWTRV